MAAAVLVALLAVVACSSGPDHDSSRRIDSVVDTLADVYDSHDPYAQARFYSAGGTLDLTEWGAGVATSPVEIVDSLRALRLDVEFDHVRAEHVFVSRDGATVWWRGFGEAEFHSWAQSYVFGPGGRTASRVFDGLEIPYVAPRTHETRLLELYDRYTAAWNRRDRRALAELYAPDVTIRGDLARLRKNGVDEVLASLDEAAFLEPGPWPQVFAYRSRSRIEAMVIVQLDGDCPRLEARRWVLSGPEIVHERRFAHLESARRCGIEVGDGWWTDFEMPRSLESNVTRVIDVAGGPVDLVNAESGHEALARWLVDRYGEGGLPLPDVRAIWFPPSPDCIGRSGLAIPDDARYDGRHTAVLCQDADDLASAATESGWTVSAVTSGIHELAHLWMLDHVDQQTEAAFTMRVGLDDWYGSDAVWRERGVEHAAATIAWGLAGTTDARYPLLPPPDCSELAARYELLTGRPPLTVCGPDGWSP